MNRDDAIDVTALIVNYNTKELLRPCIDALRASASGLRLQIVIVDNASRDGSPEWLRAEFGDCDLIFNTSNVGFGRANNQALALARGRHVLLLNTDAFVRPDSIGNTVRFLDAHPRCGLLGVRLVGLDGTLQPSCRYFPTPWNEFLVRAGLSRLFPSTRLVDDMAWDHASARECDWVPGCYYLVRKIVVDQVGLFDPRFFLYYEEVDHCRAVKAAGWSVMYCPDTTVVHVGGQSAQKDAEVTSAGRQISALQIESALLYYRKHHGRLGLWASALLASLGDALLALKWLLRGRALRGVGPYWTHAATTWALLRRTAWGRRATR
ncbi:MAG TPA: glycosyltransferase family 2 protein [Burkholderiaceae bacterium]|nr:glycosyltransferase family 2 protein [Burkholderiaceae bacterium]